VSLLEQTIAEAIRLGLAGGVPVLVLVAVVLLGAVAIVVLRHVGDVSLPPASPAEPTRENDGGGPSVPDAEWDTNVAQNDEPGGPGGGG
jgi:hypothetical protein